MTPEEAFSRRLIVEIENELDRLRGLRDESRSAPRKEDSYSLRARGSILHDFYSGIERVFTRVAEELNGGVPRGQHWHRQLVTDMTLDIQGVRPAVISTRMAERLADFLSFRHLFRNTYGHLMDAGRLRPLEGRLEETLGFFEKEIRTFLAWMAPPDDGRRRCESARRVWSRDA